MDDTSNEAVISVPPVEAIDAGGGDVDGTSSSEYDTDYDSSPHLERRDNVKRNHGSGDWSSSNSSTSSSSGSKSSSEEEDDEGTHSSEARSSHAQGPLSTVDFTKDFLRKLFFTLVPFVGLIIPFVAHRLYLNYVRVAHLGKDSYFVNTTAYVRMSKMIYGTAWKNMSTKGFVIEAITTGFRGVDTACQPNCLRRSLRPILESNQPTELQAIRPVLVQCRDPTDSLSTREYRIPDQHEDARGRSYRLGQEPHLLPSNAVYHLRG